MTMEQIEARFPLQSGSVIRGSVGFMIRFGLLETTPTGARTKNGNTINAYSVSGKGEAAKCEPESEPFMLGKEKAMEYKDWDELKTKLAIEVIASDLCDIMVPYREGTERAKLALAERNQQALDVEYRMGQTLIALETLGYEVVRKGDSEVSCPRTFKSPECGYTDAESACDKSEQRCRALGQKADWVMRPNV